MNGSQELQMCVGVQNVNLSILTGQRKKKLDQKLARALFEYRPDGKIFWKVAMGNRSAGQEAGGKMNNGYMSVRVFGNTYLCHRIVWLWHHGYLPENDLDHINHKKTDNRIENLRETSASCNLRNTGNFINNTTGIKGVSFTKKYSTWRSSIMNNGTRTHLGCSKDFLEAACLRLAAEQAEQWFKCDSSSPAFQCVKRHIPHIK